MALARNNASLPFTKGCNILKPLRAAGIADDQRCGDGVDPHSFALFKALYTNLFASGLPPPIQARNIGLYQAWRQWADWRGDSAAKLADSMSNPLYRFEELFDHVDAEIKSDPAWEKSTLCDLSQKHEASAFILAATAPFIYWSRPHAVIEPTVGLQQLLAHADLSEDIPLDFLRPPLPACYIRIGPTLRQALTPPPSQANYDPIQGVYVFEAIRNTQRALSFVPIYACAGQSMRNFHSIDLLAIDEESSVLDDIQKVCVHTPDFASHYQAVVQLCTKVFLYMGLSQAQRFDESAYSETVAQLKRVGPKRAAKLQRRVGNLYDRIVLGPPLVMNRPHGELTPHWRRGHFRMQPHGPQNSLRKVMFIPPTLVRSDRLATANLS